MHPVLASAAGSELPWFTPIAVSLILLGVAGVYRVRHRRGGKGDGPGPTRLGEGTGASNGASSPPDSPFPLLLSRLLP